MALGRDTRSNAHGRARPAPQRDTAVNSSADAEDDRRVANGRLRWTDAERNAWIDQHLDRQAECRDLRRSVQDYVIKAVSAGIAVAIALAALKWLGGKTFATWLASG